MKSSRSELVLAVHAVLLIAIVHANPVFGQVLPDPPPTQPGDLDIAAFGVSSSFAMDTKTSFSALAAYLSEVEAGYYQLGITSQWSPVVLAGADYILIDPESNAEHSIRGYLGLSKDVNEFRFDVRNLLAWRIRHGTVAPRVRARVRFRGTYLGAMEDFKLSPYVSVEPNYDFSDGAWQQTNFAVGATRTLSKRTAVELSYIYVAGHVGPDIDLVSCLWKLSY